MAQVPRRYFTREFKLAALSRVASGGVTLSAVARELGLSPGTVRNWQRQFGGLPAAQAAHAAASAGAESLEAEVLRLRREMARLRQERDILKKAVAYFAKDQP